MASRMQSWDDDEPRKPKGRSGKREKARRGHDEGPRKNAPIDGAGQRRRRDEDEPYDTDYFEEGDRLSYEDDPDVEETETAGFAEDRELEFGDSISMDELEEYGVDYDPDEWN